MTIDLMTRATLAAHLGVHANTIANYEKKGLPVIKMGRGLRRYDYSKVMEWLNLNETVKAVNK